jgi:hypothetical protein
MTIACVDALVVPFQPSQQAIRPTLDTLNLAFNYQKSRGEERPRLLGMLPIGIAETKWEQNIVNRWLALLKDRYKAAGAETGRAFMPIPYSRVLFRGNFAGSPAETSRFAEQMNEISAALHDEKVGDHE